VASLCVLVLVGAVSAVSVAFAGSPALPPKTALFANDASCSKAGITLSGSQNTISGYSHSNGAFVVSGSKNTFGPSDATCTPSVSGSQNTFNGASAPAHEQTLSFPETFNQSTVCSGATHTGTSITISSGTPSGIYCYTGSITLSESNLSAKVTFVAPSITLSGSSLNLTPAYQDLLAYETNTTLGNTGLTVSGSSIVSHGATVYAPYAAVNLSGAKYSWDGMIEGDTITISGAQSTYTGEGPAPVGLSFTISGQGSALAYPDGPAISIPLKLSNPNSDPIFVTALTVTVTNNPNGCSSATNVSIQQVNLATATSSPNALVVPANGSITLPAQGVAAPTAKLVETHTNQNQCANQTFTLSYSGSAHS
jgi:hypothetical protein